MNHKTIYAILIFALAAGGCGGAATPTTTNNNVTANANTAVVVNNTGDNPTLNATPLPRGKEAIPGIPNSTSADVPNAKDDATRNAKAQTVTRPAPDNSEISTSLGENMVETRTFKNNAQISRIEKIQDTKSGTTVFKVYLRNGQVRELPAGKVGDPMGETAANIMKVLAGGEAAKPETKNDTAETQKKQ